MKRVLIALAIVLPLTAFQEPSKDPASEVREMRALNQKQAAEIARLERAAQFWYEMSQCAAKVVIGEPKGKP
jgi:hypothetical protein